ncbi:hypothetical protein Tco_0846480 [Tanacetum coccineum]
MILTPGQPIPHGRPYHLNGPIHMMTAKKKVGPLPIPTHRLAVRHSADHFPSLIRHHSHHQNFHSDSSLFFLRTFMSYSSRPDLSILLWGNSARDHDIDPEIQAEIDECFAYADALRDRGIDARVVVEAVDRDETNGWIRPEDIPEPAQEGAVEATYETLGDLVQRFHDHTQAIPVHRIKVIEGVWREQGHMIVGVESVVIALTERITELERDNKRLRGTASVESQRVDRLQRGMSRMQRELRQMRRLQFYDGVRVGRLEACARKHMGYSFP